MPRWHPGENHHDGYYRTAHNDLYQGQAMANFVFQELRLTTAAAIHDSDPYIQGLAQAFSDAFEAIGGEMTGFVGINKEDTDMVPPLTELAAAEPEALFFPVFQPAGDHLAAQARGVPGLENTQMLAADGLLTDGYLALEQTEGMYFSGPDERFGDAFNESTGFTAYQVLVAYEERYGEKPTSSFWAHGYDAMTLMLDAIFVASYVDGDGSLVISCQGIRNYLDNVKGYSGLIGSITCDTYGDCGSQRISVVYNEDSSNTFEDTKANVVFSFGPDSR